MEEQKIYEVPTERADHEIEMMQQAGWHCIGRIDNGDTVILRFER
jgi:hypothetical protein